LPQAHVLFNYFGHIDDVLASEEEPEGILHESGESFGALRHPQNRRAHLIEINCIIMGGRLQMAVECHAAHFNAETMGCFKTSYEANLRALTMK
jgi:non-ribosomal peptide synthase protein (TIGR01720 family)